MCRFGAELIQYRILCQIQDSSRGGSKQGWVVGRLQKPQLFHPFKPTDIERIPARNLAPSVRAANRFASGIMSQARWDEESSYVGLPAGTELQLEHVPSSPEAGVERRRIVISKP